MSAISVAPTSLFPIRHDWSRAEVEALFDLPLTELLHRAGSAHRLHFDPAEVQVSTLLSVKTGGCPEDCTQRACDHRGQAQWDERAESRS